MYSIDDNSLLNKHLATGISGFWMDEVVKPEYKEWKVLAGAELLENSKRIYQLAQQASALASRNKWLEGLYLVKAGKAEIRSHVNTPTHATLGVYFRTSESPTGVVMVAGVEDTEENRAEVRKFGITVYGSAVGIRA